MTEPVPSLLALPSPRVAAPVGLRASLRGGASIPIEPVEQSRAVRDSEFGPVVRYVRPAGPGEADFRHRAAPAARGETNWDRREFEWSTLPSGPFLAQQLGQSGRLVALTLESRTEVGAYAAAQSRAQGGSSSAQGLLDIHA